MTQSILHDLVAWSPALTVQEAERFLHLLLRVTDARLRYVDGESTAVPEDAPLRDVLQDARGVVLRIDFGRPAAALKNPAPETKRAPISTPPRRPVRQPQPPLTDWQTPTRQFIRDLNDLEQRRDFMWIGYVAKTMLPGLGLDSGKSQALLEYLLHAGMIVATSAPNPRNPDFPSTNVHLNRDNAFVRSALTNGESAAPAQDGRGTPADSGAKPSPTDQPAEK